MLKKLLFYLLTFVMLLGEKKLFYNSEGVVLYDITSSKIEIFKQKKLDISKEVNLEEIIRQKNIEIIDKTKKMEIKYIEYDNSNQVYNVYYELKFITPWVELFLDKTLIMGIYDENFNYLKVEKYPVYMFGEDLKLIEEIVTYKNGAVLFLKLYNDRDLKSLKYEYNEKYLYLIEHKNGTGELNDEHIKEVFHPQYMDRKKTFILGTSGAIDTIENNQLYNYNLKTGKVEKIKEFPNTSVFIQTLIDNGRKLIYLTLSPFEDTEKYGNKGRKIFVLDLKNMKEKELQLSPELFEEFYYSHEIQNTDNRLIEQFSE